jgi:hypothetical protein
MEIAEDPIPREALVFVMLILQLIIAKSESVL